MKKGFRQNMSANTLQLIINQLFNLLTFYLLSGALSKKLFGELNWTLAFFLFAFSVASFGYDQLVIRKAAEGKGLHALLSLHLFHVLFTGCAVYLLLLLAALLFPFFFSAHPLLLLLGFGKLLLYFSTPFKALTTGRERFRLLLWMSVVSAVLKGLCLLLLSLTHHLTLSAVILVFILADALELIGSLFFFSGFFGWRFRLSIQLNDYLSFFKAALPQVGIIIFAAALARTDWLLIGLFLSPANLAEYSFAYKAFEISSLPLLIIAPLLVPWFTRLQKAGIPVHQHPPVQLLIRTEIMVVCFTALCLNLLWNPLIDNVTGNRYGSVNTRTIFILSLTLPVLYLNNFLWSLHFAKGNLRLILHSFALCFSLNVAGNLFLLPLYGNEGAAIAYLLSISAQTLFYLVKIEAFYGSIWVLAGCAACAFFSGYLTPLFTTNTFLWPIIGMVVYSVLLIVTIQIRQKDWKLLRQVMTA